MSGLDPLAAAEGLEDVDDVAADTLLAPRPLRKDVVRRFRQNRLAVVGLVFIVLLLLVAVFAPLIAPYDYDERTPGAFREAPSAEHWFGTDTVGYDVFSRVVYGARISMRVGILATLIAMLIGLVLGAISGYVGGKTDGVIMRITDVFLAIPYIILAIAVATIFGKSVNSVILVLGLTGWLGVCRIVRASFLSLSQLEYVEAAKALGFGHRRIIFRHILPNALQPVIVYATIEVGTIILAEAALSFLGVGPEPPTPAWGLMVAEAKSTLAVAPHMLIFPGLAIFLTVLAFVFVGDGLRDALDPKLEVSIDAGPLLSVRDLRAGFDTPDGLVRAIDGVSFDIARGQVFAVVGESGSGKSVTAQSIMGLLPTLEIESGQVLWKGEDVLTMSEPEQRRIRGGEIAMIFQDPLSALNPVHTVGRQIGEMARVHEGLSRKDAFSRAVEMLDLVGIPEAAKRAKMYPHEFSGGMRQRAMIAMAITCQPDLLIADEPTTALDVTVQAQVLQVLLDIKDEIDSAIMLITHDLGVVAGLADEVMVMYAGRQAEVGPTDELFYRSRHPYTLGLLASLPRVDDTGVEVLVPIKGQPPSLIDVPAGCAFHPRCRFAVDRCKEVVPPLMDVPELPPGVHQSACIRLDDLETVTVGGLRQEEEAIDGA